MNDIDSLKKIADLTNLIEVHDEFTKGNTK